MKVFNFLLSVLVASALTGCTTLPNNRPTGLTSVPCTYRFKSLSRAEDQSRVEAAIHTVAVGPVVKMGTLAYPEYRFRVARLADLDRLTPQLLYSNPDTLLATTRKQTLNLRASSVEMTFDSTDVSASATTLVTFHIKPGSRLYYKTPGGTESDITAKVDKKGQVVLPITIKEGQKYLHVRALKDNVIRYIRINIFTNHAEDISRRDY